jgi:hypothetical protein
MDSALENDEFHADITAHPVPKGSEQLRVLNELRRTLADPIPHYPNAKPGR